METKRRTFLYIAVGWMLLVYYTIPLASVVESLIDLSNVFPPDDNLRQMLIFLYGLAIVSFLGGSQIPAVFLKRKSFVIQFGFSATFGLMLLIINLFNENTLMPVNETVLKPFFLNYPIVALQYLSIPYLFMIFIDFYSSGRFTAFSWRNFRDFLGGTFLHPRLTFTEIINNRSTLFSFVSVILVSVAWMARTVAFSSTDFVPTRWRFIHLYINESFEAVSKTLVIIPSMLILWLVMSVLMHVAVQSLGGKGRLSELGSLVGFAFLPSLVAIPVDLLEFGLFRTKSWIVLDVVFTISGFVIPLVLWPLMLIVFAIQASEKPSLRGAVLIAIVVFMPLFILLTRLFL